MTKWKSCAEWPKGTCDFSFNVTTDTHDTKEQADCVCRMLRNNGFGGEDEIYPIKTWVEELK